MCYSVKCGKCGKTTWSGCGRHVASVYGQIGEGQHCLCRDWPGVKIQQTSQIGEVAAAASSSGIKTQAREQGSSGSVYCVIQ